MSERNYFERRTAVPGFSFLLFVIAMNCIPLSKILADSGVEPALGVFLAVLTLLGGSAIGFLVSQVWWWRFQRKGAQYSGDLSAAIHTLTKKYSLIEPSARKEMDKVHNVLGVWGYVLHHEMQRKGMKQIVTYTTRRWDVYHLQSALRDTLLLSLVVGLSLRIFCEFFVFNWDGNVSHAVSAFADDPRPFLAELIILIGILVAVLFLWYILGKGREHVAKQYDRVSEAIIRNSDLTEADLRKAFVPNEDYFKQKDNKHES